MLTTAVRIGMDTPPFVSQMFYDTRDGLKLLNAIFAITVLLQTLVKSGQITDVDPSGAWLTNDILDKFVVSLKFTIFEYVQFPTYDDTYLRCL